MSTVVVNGNGISTVVVFFIYGNSNGMSTVVFLNAVAVIECQLL